MRLLPLVRRFHRDGRDLLIFVGHGVYNETMRSQAKAPRGAVLARSLIATAKLISKHFEIISLPLAVEMIVGTRPPRSNCAVITFDDSLKCLAEIAAPALASIGVTATFFLSTAAIDVGRPYWWRRLEHFLDNGKGKSAVASLKGREIRLPTNNREESVSVLKSLLKGANESEKEQVTSFLEEALGTAADPARDPHCAIMTWSDVHKLRDLGMTVGSHTVGHPNLSLLSEAEVKREMLESRQAIEAHLGTPCEHFCYPHGQHSDMVVRCASALYRSAVTTIAPGWNRLGGSPFRLRRTHLPLEPYRLFRTIKQAIAGPVF